MLMPPAHTPSVTLTAKASGSVFLSVYALTVRSIVDFGRIEHFAHCSKRGKRESKLSIPATALKGQGSSKKNRVLLVNKQLETLWKLISLLRPVRGH